MSLEGVVSLGIFLGFGALGVRSTIRLWRIVLYDGETRRQHILIGLALICTGITATALWFGFTLIRRALGFDPLPRELALPVGIFLVSCVLAIPTAIEHLVDGIARTGR